MKGLLDSPTLYLLLQSMVGAKKARRLCITEFAKPIAGERLFDIGCGPGYVIDYLPAVDYVGTDVDCRYIDYARKRYGSRGEFHCVELTQENAADFGKFDIALLNGVLHHIDDEGVVQLLQVIQSCLNQNGRLITLDGCYYAKMSPISRWMIDNDRGEYVRHEDAYLHLAKTAFTSVTAHHRTDLFSIPYDALVMECRT